MRSGQDLRRPPKSPTAASEFAIFFVSTPILRLGPSARLQNLAGAEGFEPPSPVLETGSLTVELTPLNYIYGLKDFRIVELQKPANSVNSQIRQFVNYFTSLCGVCLRHRRQNFFSSSRSGVVLRF